ncbi:MAG: cytochrome c biogenesis protein CcsA [Armatimonadota bacterium]
MRLQWAFGVLLLLCAAGVTVLYVLAPQAGPAFMNPKTAKILFLHVPVAMQSSLFFLWSAVAGVAYLRKRRPAWDHHSRAALEVGFLFALLATLTGMVFADQQWGVAWEWDPRQQYIFILLLIYAAYFALRLGFTTYEQTAAYSAAYAIFGFLTVPFLVWVLPRMKPSQHELANRTIIEWQLDTEYGRVFLAAFFTILLLGIWCCAARVKELRASHDKEESDGSESGSGDSADSGVVRPVRLRDP